MCGTYMITVMCVLSMCCVQSSDCTPGDDEDGSIINEFDDTTKYKTTENFIRTSFQVPDENWIATALKYIAHYLRNYKFNEWDQRFYSTKPDDDVIGYYDTFPIPMLRSLHWKVYQNCASNFYKCITYLQSEIQNVPFSHSDDIVTFLNENTVNNDSLIKVMNTECAELKMNSERSSFPFDDPAERFQWRTTAAYYMCWYTMLGTPELSMLGEPCDNFANCLDPKLGYKNRDPRSDDRMSFACAMYSFCPDPCCPLKHVAHLNECQEKLLNPCFEENGKREFLYSKCILDRKENSDLEAIIRNKWNVSCNCKKAGFIWKSRFGMCVDVNECLALENACDKSTEDCLNTPGSYRCICKWGFELENNNKKCVLSNLNLLLGKSLVVSKNMSYYNYIISLLNYIGIEL